MLMLIKRNMGSYITIIKNTFQYTEYYQKQRGSFHSDKGINPTRGKMILNIYASNTELPNI